MKRYINTLMGMKEDDYGKYCEYNDWDTWDDEKNAAQRALRASQHDVEVVNTINLDLTEQLKQANEALSAITEVVMSGIDGTKKDRAVKKIYGIGDDVTEVNIAMRDNDYTKIDIQKYHSDFAGK